MSNESITNKVADCAKYVRAEALVARNECARAETNPTIPVERAERLRRRTVLLNDIAYWMAQALADVERLNNETGGA